VTKAAEKKLIKKQVIRNRAQMAKEYLSQNTSELKNPKYVMKQIIKGSVMESIRREKLQKELYSTTN
jgi:hypothetical protein